MSRTTSSILFMYLAVAKTFVMHVPYLLIRKDTQKKFMCNEKQYGHCYSYNSNANTTLSFFFMFLLGYPFLHTTMALEKLGSRQNHCLNDGPRHRGRLRGGKEAKEKTLA